MLLPEQRWFTMKVIDIFGNDTIVPVPVRVR
jgi:hypothetical protein